MDLVDVVEYAWVTAKVGDEGVTLLEEFELFLLWKAYCVVLEVPFKTNEGGDMWNICVPFLRCHGMPRG